VFRLHRFVVVVWMAWVFLSHINEYVLLYEVSRHPYAWLFGIERNWWWRRQYYDSGRIVVVVVVAMVAMQQIDYDFDWFPIVVFHVE